MLPSLLSPTALTRPFLNFYIQAEITVDWNAAEYKLNITDYFPLNSIPKECHLVTIYWTQELVSIMHLTSTIKVTYYTLTMMGMFILLLFVCVCVYMRNRRDKLLTRVFLFEDIWHPSANLSLPLCFNYSIQKVASVLQNIFRITLSVCTYKQLNAEAFMVSQHFLERKDPIFSCYPTSLFSLRRNIEITSISVKKTPTNNSALYLSYFALWQYLLHSTFYYKRWMIWHLACTETCNTVEHKLDFTKILKARLFSKTSPHVINIIKCFALPKQDLVSHTKLKETY